MKRYLLLLLSALLVLLPSCGYRLGGLRRANMKNLETFCVEVFENRTLYPSLSSQITTAVVDTLQRDGSYRLAPADDCDFKVSGIVDTVAASGLRTNAGDTYLSSEVGLTVHVNYTITNCRTGKVLLNASVQAQGSFFNDDTGNVQTARESALSYATRRAAELIVQALTMP